MTTTTYSAITREVGELIDKHDPYAWFDTRALDPPVPDPTLRDLATEVCARCGVSLADLRGESMCRRFVRPRQEFMALARATGRYSYPRIGRFLGGRDHTTIIYGVRAHLERVAG